MVWGTPKEWLEIGDRLFGKRWRPIAILIFVVLALSAGLAVFRFDKEQFVSIFHPPQAAAQPYLFVECKTLLGGWATVPASGLLYQLGVYPWRKSEGAGLQQAISRPGAPAKLPYDLGPFGGSSYSCRITNYASEPLFNVRMTLRLIFKKAKWHERSDEDTGVVELDRPWTIQIPKVDAGVGNTFEFFPYSAGPDFARLLFPSQATTEIGDQHQAKIVEVRTSTTSLVFVPFWLGYAKPRIFDNVASEQKKKPVAPPPAVNNSPGSIIAPSGGNNSITNYFGGAQQRSISEADATAIASDLRAAGPHKFTLVDYAGGQKQEVATYKKNLFDLLVRGGWTPQGDKGKTFLPMGGAPLIGLHFLTKTDSVPESDVILFRIFSAHHVPIVADYIKFPMWIDGDETAAIAVGQAEAVAPK